MGKGKILVLIIISVVAVYYFKENLGELKKIQNISFWIVLSLVLLNIMTRLIVGFRIKIIGHALNINLSIKEWFGLAAINSFYNYLFTKSGLMAVALYFKKKYETPVSKYVITSASAMLFSLLAASLIVLPISVTLKVYGYDFGILIIIFSVCLVFSSFLFFYKGKNLKRDGLFQKVNAVLEGWKILRASRNLWGKLLVCELLYFFLFSIRYFFVLQAFGYDAPLWVCFLLAPLSILSQLIGIFPGEVGSRELVAGLLTQSAGLGIHVGIMATALDRVVVTAIAFILGPIFSYLLIKGMDNSQDSNVLQADSK
tara:strand:- start:536 stop:1474 length:939 start_codon:yes stop_codon:yes gene_type:complete